MSPNASEVRATTVAPGSRLSRRSVLKGAMAGGGVAVLAGVAASLNGVGAAQIELGTPVAVPPEAGGATPAAQFGPTVASKAAELGFDVERIFRFVADEIRYEPYAGALRGANGTLWSLAGNSVDKSTLLAALLDESLVEYRFAIGQLDDAGIEQLRAAMTTDAAALTRGFARAQINGFTPTPAGLFGESTPVADAPVTGVQQQQIDEMTSNASSALDLAAELTELQLSIIEDALASGRVDLPPLPESVLPDSEMNRHIWIQIADGPVWIDYAPALNGAESGLAPTSTITETVPEIPVDLIHTVTFRIIAEEYFGGASARRDAISLQFASADLVNVPVSFMVMPPPSLSNIGLTLTELFTGQATFVPVMLARDIGYTADVPIVFGASGGSSDVLSAEGEDDSLGDGETLALWLAVDIASPGVEPVTIERPLFDRVGFAGRQNETIDFGAVEPVTMVTDAEGESYVADLVSAHLISVDSARLPFTYALQDVMPFETFGAMALANPGLLSLRDALRLSGEIPRGSHSWISSPQMTVVSVSKEDPADLTSGIILDFDLLHHAPTAWRLDGGSASVEGSHPLLLAGVTDQIAEQVMVESSVNTMQGTESVRFGANLGSIFAAALDEGIEVRTLTESSDLAAIDLEPEATARISAALEAGLIVIVPEQSVEIDGVPRSGWWLIDPTTGRTRDELDTGKGGASFRVTGETGVRFGPLHENTFVNYVMTAQAAHLNRLRMKILCKAALAVALIGIGVAGGAGVAGDNEAGALASGGAVAAGGAAALTC